jgi:hypothetical protein
LGGGEEELFDLAGVEVQGGGAAAGEVGEGEAADEQGPLVDLAGDQGADRGGAADGEEDRDNELRASDASGASHCTSRN